MDLNQRQAHSTIYSWISSARVSLLLLILAAIKVSYPFSQRSIVIRYFPIAHNALCLPPKFCINYRCEILLGICRPPERISQQ